MSATDKSNDKVSTDICANCSKGEEDESTKLKTCTACKLVKYCSRDCQIAHRPQHKRECKKRAAEIQDEKLFKQPPPLDDCPICMLRLPYLGTGRMYMSCCGKVICCGCLYAPVHDNQGNVIAEKTCPFCRTPLSTSVEEDMKRMEKRIKLNDARAIYNMGGYYANGLYGLPQNMAKALELWHRAGELGYAESYYHIGNVYKRDGGLVERDENKAKRYYELAAMRGDAMARYNLGVIEANLNNINRALRHWMIAVKDGYSRTLKCIKALYSNGDATKDDYNKALRSYQAYLDEIKSDQRDEAAASNTNGRHKYYESAI
jgi:hypothetical protein